MRPARRRGGECRLPPARSRIFSGRLIAVARPRKLPSPRPWRYVLLYRLIKLLLDEHRPLRPSPTSS